MVWLRTAGPAAGRFAWAHTDYTPRFYPTHTVRISRTAFTTCHYTCRLCCRDAHTTFRVLPVTYRLPATIYRYYWIFVPFLPVLATTYLRFDSACLDQYRTTYRDAAPRFMPFCYGSLFTAFAGSSHCAHARGIYCYGSPGFFLCLPRRAFACG